MTKEDFFEKINAFTTNGHDGKEKTRLNGIIRKRLTLDSCETHGIPGSVFTYEVEDFELNPYEGVHGGFICSLFDVGIAVTCCAYVGALLTTTDIHITYLRPLPAGKYRLITEITHAGSTLVSATGKIVPYQSDAVCATCTVSYMKVQPGYRISEFFPDTTTDNT